MPRNLPAEAYATDTSPHKLSRILLCIFCPPGRRRISKTDWHKRTGPSLSVLENKTLLSHVCRAIPCYQINDCRFPLSVCQTCLVQVSKSTHQPYFQTRAQQSITSAKSISHHLPRYEICRKECVICKIASEPVSRSHRKRKAKRAEKKPSLKMAKKRKQSYLKSKLAETSGNGHKKSER